MENDNTKPLTQSETFQWIVVTVIVYLVRQFGLPALPEGVQGEVVNIIGIVIDVAIPVMLGLAAKARMKARAIVDRVF
jgi:hypothetical protein